MRPKIVEFMKDKIYYVPVEKSFQRKLHNRAATLVLLFLLLGRSRLGSRRGSSSSGAMQRLYDDATNAKAVAAFEDPCREVTALETDHALTSTTKDFDAVV